MKKTIQFIDRLGPDQTYIGFTDGTGVSMFDGDWLTVLHPIHGEMMARPFDLEEGEVVIATEVD